MNIIVLIKQVPDVANIPDEAWDREKGTLRRAVLDTVFNPLDIQALTFALRMKDAGKAGRVVCLTMGPPQAREMLEDALSRGADEAVLLTDIKLSGADTPATAYALGMAVRKVARDILHGEEYIVVSGMQSVDGDTAQVPPQVAEELGIEQIAYAQDFSFDPSGRLLVRRIGPAGSETVCPKKYPVLITVVNSMDPVNRSFQFARAARTKKIYQWDALAIEADKDRIGYKGSRTWVYRIFSSAHQRAKPCDYPGDVDALLDHLERDFRRDLPQEKRAEVSYVLGDKTPTYHGEVWVYAEHSGGRLAPVSLEILAKARDLADSLKEKVAAVLVGHNVASLAPALLAAGADKVYLAEHPLLNDFLPSPYKKTVAALVLQHRPQIVLLGATPLGRELAPRIAYAVGAGLTADCTALEIDDHSAGADKFVGILKQTRPALGGNIMATIMTKDAPFQMATVRPGVFCPLPTAYARSGEVVRCDVMLNEADLLATIVAREPVIPRASLQEADIIVSGGRGLGSRAGFERCLFPLAEALAKWLKVKVEVAASRMAVEDGFIGHDHQVGQTGQTVRPRLYVAVGISGAVQHITGMQNSSVILAINKDPQAKIYQHADYGMVGSAETEIKRLLEAIARRPS